MKSITVLFILALLATACGPSDMEISLAFQATLDSIPTQTPAIIRETVLVTPKGPTSTPRPTITVGPTSTPRPTNTPKPTIDILKTDKPPGIYLVGIDIAPGVWRNNGSGGKCYWSITSKTGDIIDNFYGQSGGTLYLRASAFQVELTDGCGRWTWLSD
jgi:hypothetical protein